MSYVHDVIARAGDWLSEKLSPIHQPDLKDVDGFETIEFFGGPFDGTCRQVKTSMVYQLPPALELPVVPGELELSEDWATLDGRRVCKESPSSERSHPARHTVPSTLALYDLVLHGSNWEYRFGGQLPHRSS